MAAFGVVDLQWELETQKLTSARIGGKKSRPQQTLAQQFIFRVSERITRCFHECALEKQLGRTYCWWVSKGRKQFLLLPFAQIKPMR